MYYQRKRFHCADCNRTFEQVVGEAILSAVCPACGRLARLVRFGMAQGLTLTQALAAVGVSFLLYKLLTD